MRCSSSKEERARDDARDGATPLRISAPSSETVEPPWCTSKSFFATVEPSGKTNFGLLVTVEPCRKTNLGLLVTVQPYRKTNFGLLVTVGPCRETNLGLLVTVEPCGKTNSGLLVTVEPCRQQVTCRSGGSNRLPSSFGMSETAAAELAVNRRLERDGYLTLLSLSNFQDHSLPGRRSNRHCNVHVSDARSNPSEIVLASDARSNRLRNRATLDVRSDFANGDIALLRRPQSDLLTVASSVRGQV
jgi:hypothetical protein